ncbi:MAG: hypothetical protein C0467_07085 [Planctomycetaceae bacterium]|nr:hypothetical protein [Planctomycetaceae bacterium]
MYATDPTAPQFTPTVAAPMDRPPVIGFTDAAGRFFPLAFTAKRVEIAHAIGIDLPRVMASERGPSRMFSRSDLASLVRVVQLAIIAAGGDDQEPPGVQLPGAFVSPEDFARLMAVPKTFEAATLAILEAMAAYFPNSPGSKSILAARPRLRVKGK